MPAAYTSAKAESAVPAVPASAASDSDQTVGGALAAAMEPVTAELRSSFVLPVIPDTQFYSRYSSSQFYPKYDTNPFEVQTEWLVENQDELNIPFAVHVGDVVDQQWVTGEWDAAAKAMQQLTDTTVVMKRFINAQQYLGDDASKALARLGEAASAVARLADFLERNPSALLSGRATDGKK